MSSFDYIFHLLLFLKADPIGNHMMIINILLLSLTFSSFVIAENYKKMAIENFNGVNIRFSQKMEIKNSTLSISGPNGFSASNSVVKGLPSINLFDYGTPSDGRYKYQITSSIIGETKINSSQQLNNGRMSQESRYKNINISQSGHFNLERGQIKLFNDTNDSNIAISR